MMNLAVITVTKRCQQKQKRARFGRLFAIPFWHSLSFSSWCYLCFSNWRNIIPPDWKAVSRNGWRLFCVLRAQPNGIRQKISNLPDAVARTFADCCNGNKAGSEPVTVGSIPASAAMHRNPYGVEEDCKSFFWLVRFRHGAYVHVAKRYGNRLLTGVSAVSSPCAVMGCRQVVRHGTLTPGLAGPNPASPVCIW